MKKGDVIRQKCVNTTFYLTGILAHKVNNRRTKIANLHGVLSSTKVHDHRHEEYKVCFVVLFFLVTSGCIL